MGTEMPELGERPPARVGDRTERADPGCRDLSGQQDAARRRRCVCVQVCARRAWTGRCSPSGGKRSAGRPAVCELGREEVPAR